jgi:hypothetical protein
MVRASSNYCQVMLSDNCQSPYGEICRLSHLTAYLAFNEAAPPKVTWSPDYTTVAVHGHHVEVACMRTGTRRLLQDADIFFRAHVLRGHVLPLLPTEPLADDMSNRDYGYNWTLSLTPTSEPHPLLSRFLREPNSPFFVRSHGSHFELSALAIRAWLHKLDDFVDQLAVLFHIGSPAPPRGTEEADIRGINDATRLRNYFHQHNHRWMIGLYDKTTNNKGRDNFVPRLVAPAVSRFIDQYIAWVVPCSAIFLHFLFGRQEAQIQRTFLFSRSGQRATSEHLSDQIKRFTQRFELFSSSFSRQA